MIEVKTRSEESWGILAAVDDKRFNQIVNDRRGLTKDRIKNEAKRIKKLKKYKVSFKKEWVSDTFILEAEDDWSIGTVARQYFKDNYDKIGFKETPRGKYAGDYKGYDFISYVKVSS